VFRVVATEALRILDVPKDLPDDEPATTPVGPNPLLDDDLAIADLGSAQPNILEDRDDDDPTAPAQTPPAASRPPANGTAPGTVPDFKGMTLRAVLMEAAARGIAVQPDGSGMARAQNPAPGAVLHQGERIRVQFAR
jgi:cell division protein FtsI (penicillin-binding protein 3)